MKFYYENLDYKVKSNGSKDSLYHKQFCHISNLDWAYGHKHPIFELNDTDNIVWNFSIIGEMNSNIIDSNKYYFENVFNKIKDKPNIRLVFSNFHEGTNQIHFFAKLLFLKDKYQIKDNRIVVVTNNKHIEPFNLHGIRIIYKPYLFGFLVDHYRDLENNSIEHKGSEIGLLNTYEYLTTPKKKFFLSYNKNTTKKFRIQLILWLIKNNILDDSFVSILIKNENFGIKDLESKQSELFDLGKYYDKFQQIGFNILDWDYPNHQNDVFSNLKYTTKSHYADTCFNIITETSFESNSLNLTEKSFKALANCHPFLIIGDRGCNHFLKTLGFHIYDDLICFDFDHVWDNEERLNKAFIEINKIYKMGRDSIMSWYKTNIDKVISNKQKFFEFSFSKMIDETIEELKEY